MSNHAERQPAKAGSNQPTTQRQVQPSGQTSRMQQLADHSPQALQLKQQTEAMSATPAPNRTGLPDQLKSGIESLSGMSMDHVKVHYNSSKPAQLQAHAYAQGSDIHVGPGQERHLQHEAWHVVQQAQGRVRPTLQMKAGTVNDDPLLEKEADMMGEKAVQFKANHVARNLAVEERVAGAVTQRVAGVPGSMQAEASPARRENQTNNAGLPNQLKSGIVSRYMEKRVIQRFSDSLNDKRRDKAAKDTGVDMQLDHAVSQDAMKKFNSILPLLSSIPAELRPDSVTEFTDKVEELFNDQEIALDGNPFLNLRNNLTPGFTNTLQNPGNLFDSQIEVRGSDIVVSKQSEHLEMLDRAMRSLVRKSAIVKKLRALDSDSTMNFRAALDDDFKMLNTALDYLQESGEQPEYDAAHWYDYKNKKVKKVSATYLEGDNGLLATLGSKPPKQNAPNTITKVININNYAYKKRKGKTDILTTTLVPITVRVTVPEEAWAHIYARHTIDYFAWDIQAINTFWKTDPQKFFTENEGNVIDELLLIIKRKMDLDSEISKAKGGDGSSTIEYENAINEAASAFFFQGNYWFEGMIDPSEPMDEDDDDESLKEDRLVIVLKSFAPQSAAFGYAVLPSALTARKPAD